MKSKKRTCRIIKRIIISLVILSIGISGLIFGTEFYYKSKYPIKYSELVEKYSSISGLEKSFVYAVIKSESGFNPNAISSADAYGLMQIQEPTFDWAKAKVNEKRSLSKEDLFNEEINIQYGCILYRLLLDEFKNADTAMAAYHAGWGNVKKWLNMQEYSKDGVNLHKVPIASTEYYIKKINKSQKIYNKLYKFDD